MQAQATVFPTAHSSITSERRFLQAESDDRLGAWDIVYDSSREKCTVINNSMRNTV